MSEGAIANDAVVVLLQLRESLASGRQWGSGGEQEVKLEVTP